MITLYTSFDKFREKQLPPKETFYSNLTESNIEDDEYERTQKNWNTSVLETSVNTMTCI